MDTIPDSKDKDKTGSAENDSRPTRRSSSTSSENRLFGLLKKDNIQKITKTIEITGFSIFVSGFIE